MLDLLEKQNSNKSQNSLKINHKHDTHDANEVIIETYQVDARRSS